MSATSDVQETPSLPVVFVPGLMCDARLWCGVRALIKTPSYVSSVVDCSTLPAMAENILATAPPRFVLVGFSMGGMAAVLAAAAAADRAAGLIILNTHGDIDNVARRAARRDQIARSHQLTFNDLMARNFMPVVLSDPGPTPARDLLKRMSTDLGVDTYRRHVLALINRPDIGGAARQVRCPAKVLAGEDDLLAPPAYAARLASAFPNATLQVVPGCGHMLPLQRPDAVADAIEEVVSSMHMEVSCP